MHVGWGRMHVGWGCVPFRAPERFSAAVRVGEQWWLAGCMGCL